MAALTATSSGQQSFVHFNLFTAWCTGKNYHRNHGEQISLIFILFNS